MNFELTGEQLEFQQSVRRFAERHLKAGAKVRAHSTAFPWAEAKLLAQQGLYGIAMPQEQGGQGGSLMDAVLAIEAVASVCPKSADLIQAGNFGAIRVLSEYGSAWQKEKYLLPLLKGESLITVGMTEPEAGSAVTDLQTTATPDGEGFRINGTKVFSATPNDLKVNLVYVRFGPGAGGIGSVLIDTSTPGYRVGQVTQFMSGEEWAQIYFDNVYIPPEMVVLGKGGFKKQIAGFNVERLGNSARALALGRYAFEEARQWAMQRKQFGRLLCEFQGIQWKFAEMKIKLDAAQLLLYRAAVKADHGLPSAEDTAIAKASCNLAGFEVANEALQVMGGLGYSQESLVEYCLRRCRGWMIAGGSLEILKNRIAEGVFERSFSQRQT